jgi:AraC-like DNA-binding protein
VGPTASPPTPRNDDTARVRDDREVGGRWREHQQHEQVAPSAALAPWVDHLWAVRWEYDEPYRQKIPPSAAVHVTARDGAPPRWYGPTTRSVHRELRGVGRVVGAAVRPGLARDLVGGPVTHLTDTARDAGGPPGLLDPAALDAWLVSRLPAAPGPAAREAAAAVALVRDDPALRRVEDLARRCGVHPRRLQRLFAEHVGVGPKWVVRRIRLDGILTRLASGAPVDWAGTAHELGYADQAHLVRDVSALLGETPTAYAARYPPGEIL